MSRIRQREIHGRRSRKKKLSMLRARYASSTGIAREQVLAKVKRVSPGLSEEQFLAMAKK